LKVMPSISILALSIRFAPAVSHAVALNESMTGILAELDA